MKKYAIIYKISVKNTRRFEKMSKANRSENVALCCMVLILIFFWISIIGAIWGKNTLSVVAIIGYTLSAICLSICICERKRIVKGFLIIESIQLVPCGLIFLIQRLI